MSKAWNFLLPETGEHKFRVDAIGTKNQRVYLDETLLACADGQVNWVGPANSILELRQSGSPKSKGVDGWALIVNGNIVEENLCGKKKGAESGLRDLRNMQEGSYIISTGFDAASLQLNTIRRYKFITQGVCQEVSIAHAEDTWQVVLNGLLVDRQGHTWRENSGECAFGIPLSDGSSTEGKFFMTWANRSMTWNYELRINGMIIEPSWIKAKGDTPLHSNPPVISLPAPGQAQPQGDVRFDGWPRQEVAPDPTPVAEPALAPVAQYIPPPPEVLPQGVSFDSTSGLYQANIRGRTGKFIFLGEFQSAQEAHQVYCENFPIHNPDKVLVPTIPS